MTPPNSNAAQNPFDEFPYLAYPIECTSPEHLALASLVHGGPRLPLERYRVLELGCANGANLLPLEFMLRNELIELRILEPGDFRIAAEPLNELETSLRNMSTSPWHTLIMHTDET